MRELARLCNFPNNQFDERVRERVHGHSPWSAGIIASGSAFSRKQMRQRWVAGSC